MNSSKPVMYLGLALLIVVLMAGTVILIKPERTEFPASALTATVPGLSEGGIPWSIQTETLKERLAALALPALKEEGTVLHTHQHLDIFIDGQKIAVPAEIGVNETEKFISPLHTHDGSGIVHIESPVVQTFTLGQLFGIWGVRLTEGCIGGYCADGTRTLKFYVNGVETAGDPNSIELTPRAEIAIIYGTATGTSKEIPSSYDFPAGL